MYLNKVAFSEMIWRKTINLLPDLVQCKIKRGHCVSAKNQKCWKNESTWVSQKRSCVKNTLGPLFHSVFVSLGLRYFQLQSDTDRNFGCLFACMNFTF